MKIPKHHITNRFRMLEYPFFALDNRANEKVRTHISNVIQAPLNVVYSIQLEVTK